MKKLTTTFFAALAGATLLFAGVASAAPVEVLWLGHSTVRITSTTGKVIAIDPFLKGNPKTPAKYRNLKALGKVDLILASHGHPDHTSDLVELAKMNNARVLSTYDVVQNLAALGLINSDYWDERGGDGGASRTRNKNPYGARGTQLIHRSGRPRVAKA